MRHRLQERGVWSIWSFSARKMWNREGKCEKDPKVGKVEPLLGFRFRFLGCVAGVSQNRAAALWRAGLVKAALRIRQKKPFLQKLKVDLSSGLCSNEERRFILE